MLARVKSVEHDGAYFRRVLKLPRPSVEFEIAREENRRASSDLRRLTERRETLKLEATVGHAAKPRLTDDVLRETLDSLADEIIAATARDQSARAEFDKLKAAYREQVSASLAADIEGLGAQITKHIGAVFELLDIATALGAEAREARVEMPALISGAHDARRLLQLSVDTTITKMTKGARA
ncbi:MAG: hypothetical protein E5V92_01965 [Mesorhizobium sp.]|uniref:hypothetical protein n=1 Tax=unclassified Mesorhizobium TaxID=325217 RepID=UPI000F74D4C7|nr:MULTISPECIES: hypothetical protein [unclassified Mesorhizobium]AZO75019.1 hypothetical protein EJ067_30495 [Mesorhizobium sp. M1D.F.Ca.ET.043.01.1.1]RWA96110.1 MAG: hypothetical protein EOQ32_00380 [Mesorhizobium sp.]TIV71445.1 MAG: hypothetical protein E5V89_10080 [Mesorhizobium sp.]TJW90390.1 MAG: hypothetical protein E5V92_01965 [Mesorhizobium sp.]